MKMKIETEKLKNWETENLLSIHPPTAFLTPFLPIPFTAKTRTGCTNETTKSANKFPINLRYGFFFHVLLFL